MLVKGRHLNGSSYEWELGGRQGDVPPGMGELARFGNRVVLEKILEYIVDSMDPDEAWCTRNPGR